MRSSGPISALPASAMPGDFFYDEKTGDTYLYWNQAWRKLPQPDEDPATYITSSDKASASKFGIMKVGDGLTASSGKVSLDLPAATADALGGVKVGTGLAIASGVLSLDLPAATADAIGGVKLVANQAASTAADVEGVVADLNTLIAALKTAGVMAADATE